MNSHDDGRDELHLQALLKAAQTDAPLPDPDALKRLRAETTAAYTAAAAQAPPPGARSWRPAVRWLGAAASIALVATAAAVYLRFAPERSRDAFGQVLANTENVDTLQLRFTINAGLVNEECWHTRNPPRSRWDNLAGNYRIADGKDLWLVNEKANEARRAREPADLNHPVLEFLEKLGLPKDRQALLDARPVKRIHDGPTEVLVYQCEVPGPEGIFSLEAMVVAKTLHLHWCRARLGGRDRGEMAVVAVDRPIDAAKFVVADTLTEDGRIGTVSDVQGIVGLKPVLGERWTPVRPKVVLMPGDWIRTDARGANAAALSLVKQTGVVLGPKTLVELIGPKRVRLVEGEIEIAPSAGMPIELVGPAGTTKAVDQRQLFRIDKQQLVRVSKDPPWLLGFKGATTNETLGSLVALVDGRNVPLTVGYHKVTVDIRDQIARTVIEESFVNHTDAQLEGIFHFPLPEDASIAGFGMWIGANLIEADVVEKQRAREIYETILRERRDPGLLEWSGGNIFKARVFPILPHAEKRIKITYTQVLPLKGSRYRYSYALQSELLQQHPLRELSIDVKVSSVAPLKNVSSPTHPTRDEHTAHSAHVEFTAQEYTPTRDFEVVVELEGRQSDVVMIPHRRGDDGYFMLQLTPPGSLGDWDRPLVPNGVPLHLLILADTSASMDAGQRAKQETFLGALLGSLSPKDTFNLAACDVTCDWAFPEPAHADANHIRTAREFLAQRTSLGWTNLDVAFAAALKQAGPTTHVVYVGDGIVTAGDADPVAFAKRLRRMYENQTATCHAIALGSSYEASVLKTIASLGGGSLRKITGEQGPQTIALELLGEIAQPTLRDIKVEFKGIRVARLYPETLANVPSGSQQILMGRYLPAPSPRAPLPEGEGGQGEVIVTGTQAGKPVRFSTRVSFKDAGHGNSFIPRLWARMHLDSLLEQGASETLKDEIISLSEEYKIITPYTSFLVLETDADRERFKVKRRFQMRDGERFFADGRDNAVFDLAQKQMKKAGDWRTAQRRAVLRELAQLGRDSRWFQPTPSWRYNRRLGAENLNMLMDSEMFLGEPENGPLGGAGYGGGLHEFGLAPLGDLGLKEEREQAERAGDGEAGLDVKLAKHLAEDFKKRRLEPDALEIHDQAKSLADHPFPGAPVSNDDDATFREDALAAASEPMSDQGGVYYSLGRTGGGYFGRDYRRIGHQYGQWLNTLFPPLQGTPGEDKEPKSTWPAAARDLAKSLLRTEKLAKMTGGIEIVRQNDTFDVRWGDLRARSRRLDLVSAKAWLTRSGSEGGQTLVSWCNAKEIGILSKAFQLGRVRASAPRDVQPPPLALDDYSLVSLERTYYDASVEPQGKDRTLLVLTYSSSPEYQTRILIDTARHVILSMEEWHKGKATSIARLEDFVEAAGGWWAQRVETTDGAGKRQSLITQTIKTRTLAELDKQMTAELAERAQVQFIHLPLPGVANAKKAQAAGKATFDDQFVLMLHFLRSQQWARVLDHLRQAEALAVNKPGLRWLRSAVLYDSRRHEELRLRYREDAVRLAKGLPSADAYFLAQYVVGQATNVLQANEMLALADPLRPLYEKQPSQVFGSKSWLHLRARYLGQAGRQDEALRLQKELATDYPRDWSIQQEYAQALVGIGDYPAAYAWLTRVLVKEAKWRDDEAEALRGTYTGFLEQQGRYADLVTYLAGWVEENPIGRAAYEQYLSALVRSDQIEKAEALALRWLKDAEVPGELAPPAERRLNAAVALMLGNGYQLYTNRVRERWQTPLAEAVLFFARHEANASTAEQIMSSQGFRNTEEGTRVRKRIAGILVAEIDKLPAEQVRRFVNWVQRDDVERGSWDKVIAKLRQRWTNEPREDVKRVLGLALVGVLSGQDMASDLLTFLRLQWKTGPAKHRDEYGAELFDRLLEQPWSAEIEAEAFAMFDKLSTAQDAGERLFKSVATLYRLTDRLVDSRITAGNNKIEHAEKLTRTELLKKQADIRQSARSGLADRLRQEAAKHPKALAQWLVAESLYLDVLLDRNLQQVAAEAWEYLGAAPPASPKADQPAKIEQVLGEILRQRYLITVTNLAARKGAEPALIERLVKYLDRGVSDDLAGNRWKTAEWRLLIALDRPKAVEQTLRQWTRQDDSDNRWRVALGYLLAEAGRLPEAIQQFEAVEKDDELTPSDYRALAGWYLVEGKRDKSERAARAVYGTTPENQLYRMILAKLRPWQLGDGHHLPTELDREVLRMFAVLFDKSVTPQSYLYSLQQFYQASRDFRLLSGLPDAVIGHTAERVYPFVQGMQSVLTDVRDEATADEIVKRIGEVRPRAKTVVDQRALDLLEVLVERRAAEVQNQPGPRVAKALTALQRAFKRAWSPGEPRLMADFLAGLGKITQASLADEQLRELKTLYADAAPRTIDGLHIAYRYGTALHAHGSAAAAIDILQAALDEFQAANNGVLPVIANDPLASFIAFLEGAGHFARGEKVLAGQLTHPVHAQQRRWLIERLERLYHHALQKGGDVSIGKDLTLYRALNAKIEKDLADPDQNHRHQLINVLCGVYRTAHEKKLEGVVGDLKTFAFQVLPPLFKQTTNNQESIIGTVAQTIHDLAGPRDGIAFLLDRIDSEPRWLRYNNQDGWVRHGYMLGSWRLEAKDLGEIEGRLLKRVLAELRRDLETRERRNGALYDLHSDRDRFWKEKTADFAKTADGVLAERSKSNLTVQYIADYFYWGIEKPNRAIEILFVAYNQKILDDAGQAKLVDFLHREGRYGESIAVLQPLIERHPDALRYRVQLMHAFFRTNRETELLALLKQTDTFFHQKDRWNEGALRQLAESTLQNELHEQSVVYYKELIPLHERTAPHRGVGDGTLADYYGGLARAYAGLKKTPEAVDAAGAAIVTWGQRKDGRDRALDALKLVLLRSPDLDAYVRHLDQQKQDSAVIRKALGQAYQHKREHAKAIKQLELAIALQPNDAETYQLLIASHDKAGDKAGAVRQLLQAVQLSRRELKLYEDLGKRFHDLGQAREAERAYTSIVEMQPTESESHALLAEVREKQNRWPEAIAEWEQVARLRALEPTGLLKLAAAQIHEKRWDKARASLRQLNTGTWPARFNDVQDKVRRMERELPDDRKQ